MLPIISDLDRYGLLVVLIGVSLAEVGVPLPAFPILVTAGAVITKSRYQVVELIAVGMSGTLIADLCLYWSGKRYGGRVLGVLCKMSLSPNSCVGQAETLFLRIGKWSLLYAKFFPALSTISMAMAGITEMPMVTFLFLSGAGALLFVIVAVLTGWIFRDAIIDVLNAIAAIGKFGFLSALLAVCLYLLARWWRGRAFVRQLRMDRITVAGLRRLIDEGRKPLILDARPAEIRAPAGSIPGAMTADLIAPRRDLFSRPGDSCLLRLPE
jgi:membrane protein DedA with SNARE-associated domain